MLFILPINIFFIKMNELIQEYDIMLHTYYFSIENKYIYLKDIYDKISKAEKEKSEENEEFKAKEHGQKKEESNQNNITIEDISMEYEIDEIDLYYKVKLLEPHNDFKPIHIYSPKKIKLGTNEATLYNYQNLESFIKYHEIKEKEILINNNPNIILKGILRIQEDTISITINQNTNINKEYKVKIKNKKSKLLSEICNNKKYINFQEDSEYLDTPERIKLINTIQKLLVEYKALFLYGPSGIGKSVTLLNLSRKTDNIVLYLNLKYLYKIYDLSQLYNEIIEELSFCFTNKIEFNQFINNDLKYVLLKSKEKNNQYDFLCKIIKSISSYLSLHSPFDKQVYIILDQYQSIYDIEKKIIKALNEAKDIKVIICSSMYENNVRETISNLFFKNIEFNLIYNLPLFYLGNINLSGLSDKKKNLLVDMFGRLPRYYEEIKNIDENKIEEYENDKYNYISKKINNLLNSKIYNTNKSKIKLIRNILNNENIELETNNFKEIFDFLPLKYFFVIKNKNNTFTYKYAFKFIKYVYERILKEASNIINKELFDESKNNIEKAWNFESLVNNYFIEGTKPFFDLEYVIKKTIYVDSIFDLKEVDFQVSLNDNNISLEENNILLYKIGGTKEKIKKCQEYIVENGIINICQRPFGESYDGALLIPTGNTKNKREYYMLLYQVTLDKDYSTFLCRLKIVDSIPNIKKKFESIYDIKIKSFYFMYILYYFRKGLVKVEKLCEQYINNLYYCYYNPETKELLNKKGAILIWNLVKQNCKIIKFSKDILNYNKTLYFLDEIKEEVNEKILNIKIDRDKNNNSFENKLEENEKMLIQKKLKCNAITFNISKLKTVGNEESSDDNSFSVNDDMNTINTSSNNNINNQLISMENKTKKQIKSDLKNIYLEQNKLSHINELIPKENNYEKANIKGNNNYLNEKLAEIIKKLLSVDKKIIINGRNFYSIHHIINQSNAFFLYYNCSTNNLILAYNDENKKEIILYDLTKLKKISSEEYSLTITSFLNLDYLINNKIICYFLYFEY